MNEPLVSLVAEAAGDFALLKQAASVLDEFNVPHHLGDQLQENSRVIIATAERARLLARETDAPVLAVPIKRADISALDALQQALQPGEEKLPAVLALGEAGAKNAALLAIQILALDDPGLRERLRQFREKQTHQVLNTSLAENSSGD